MRGKGDSAPSGYIPPGARAASALLAAHRETKAAVLPDASAAP